MDTQNDFVPQEFVRPVPTLLHYQGVVCAVKVVDLERGLIAPWVWPKTSHSCRCARTIIRTIFLDCDNLAVKASSAFVDAWSDGQVPVNVIVFDLNDHNVIASPAIVVHKGDHSSRPSSLTAKLHVALMIPAQLP
jgi:hypothetical protein